MVDALHRPDSFSRPFVAHLYTHLFNPFGNRGFCWTCEPDATTKPRGFEGVTGLVYKGEPFVGRVWLRKSRRGARRSRTLFAHPVGHTVAESTVDCVSAETCTNIPRASKVSVREFANSAALVLSQATDVTTVIVNGAAVPSRLQLLPFAVIPPPGRLVGPSLRPSAPRTTTI